MWVDPVPRFKFGNSSKLAFNAPHRNEGPLILQKGRSMLKIIGIIDLFIEWSAVYKSGQNSVSRYTPDADARYLWNYFDCVPDFISKHYGICMFFERMQTNLQLSKWILAFPEHWRYARFKHPYTEIPELLINASSSRHSANVKRTPWRECRTSSQVVRSFDMQPHYSCTFRSKLRRIKLTSRTFARNGML